jgi:hypothetical protein
MQDVFRLVVLHCDFEMAQRLEADPLKSWILQALGRSSSVILEVASKVVK